MERMRGFASRAQEAYGGLVHDAVYEDICIRNSKAPIQLDTNYSANPKPGKGLIPVFTDITLRNVRISGGGKIQLNGFDATHRIGIQFDGVQLVDGQDEVQVRVEPRGCEAGAGAGEFQDERRGFDGRGERRGKGRWIRVRRSLCRFR